MCKYLVDSSWKIYKKKPFIEKKMSSMWTNYMVRFKTYFTQKNK